MIVFDIKRYAINDGPGIRTTVFLKGCPLRCVWCHNPESWRAQAEWLFKQQKCIGCNTCGIYPHQLELISRHEAIPEEAASCPTLALERCGRSWSLDQLMAELEKERAIMTDSGGGVTFSGGEPLMQHDELLAALCECGRAGFHRCVDTTLYAAPEVVSDAVAETDLWLVDLKLMDSEKHKRYTGVGNELIHSNLRLLASLGARFQLRIPLIEGINADTDNISATARFAAEIKGLCKDAEGQLRGVALLPYHEMGRDKHARRGTHYNPEDISMTVPSDDTLERCIRLFEEVGVKAKIGG